MAALLAAGMDGTRNWSETEIAALLASPGVFDVVGAEGFALGRAVAGEAELLTIVVAPEARRRGTGRALLASFEAAAAARGALSAFLEVAEDNAPARALYALAGYAEAGRRKAYFRRAGQPVDAYILRKALGAA